jgi:uncharacterized protein YoxC
MKKELIAQIANFMKEASDSVSKLETERDTVLAENAQLKEKVASLETGQQKTASVDNVVMSVESTNTLVDNLIQAGFLKEGSRNAAVAAMSADPLAAAKFLDDMAVKSIKTKSLPSLGAGEIEKIAGENTDEFVDHSARRSDDIFEQHFG